MFGAIQPGAQAPLGGFSSSCYSLECLSGLLRVTQEFNWLPQLPLYRYLGSDHLPQNRSYFSKVRLKVALKTIALILVFTRGVRPRTPAALAGVSPRMRKVDGYLVSEVPPS